MEIYMIHRNITQSCSFSHWSDRQSASSIKSRKVPVPSCIVSSCCNLLRNLLDHIFFLKSSETSTTLQAECYKSSHASQFLQTEYKFTELCHCKQFDCREVGVMSLSFCLGSAVFNFSFSESFKVHACIIRRCNLKHVFVLKQEDGSSFEHHHRHQQQQPLHHLT